MSTSHAFASFIRHSFTCRSSAPDTTSGRVGWNAAQFTPRSWPSSTCFTIAPDEPNKSIEEDPEAADVKRRLNNVKNSENERNSENFDNSEN